MQSALNLLKAYLANLQNPSAAAALYTPDGILEVPWVNAFAKGPREIESLLQGIVAQLPDFSAEAPTIWIETSDRVCAEYDVESIVRATGKLYRQTYVAILIAKEGRIERLRLALNTAETVRAFAS